MPERKLEGKLTFLPPKGGAPARYDVSMTPFRHMTARRNRKVDFGDPVWREYSDERFLLMKRISRRQFVRTAASAVALPYFIPSSVLGADAPSKKITIGFIGTGDHGTHWNL